MSYIFKGISLHKVLITAGVGVVLISGGFILGSNHTNQMITSCNAGSDDACESLLKSKPHDDYIDRLNPDILKEQIAKKRSEDAALIKQANILERFAEQAQTYERFKAEGWFELQSGIYGRWCTSTCSNTNGVVGQPYWLLEIWAKDANAGNIYSSINIIKNGLVVDWTDDTTYLSKGQRGVLEFTKNLSGPISDYSGLLTEFSARG